MLVLVIEEIDPRRLRPHPNNPRTEYRDMDPLRESIKEFGILQPLVVVLDPGDEPAAADGCTHTVRIGHRRRAAALDVEKETVPCIVAESEAAAEQLIKMMMENLLRDDLTPSEEAAGFAQLVLMDVPAEQIARKLGRPLPQVKQALTLTKLPVAAQAAADSGALSLEDAATLEEFSDDPTVIAKLVEKGTGSWGMKHLVAEERSRRTRKEKTERLKAELVIAGVKIIPQPKDWPDGKAAEASTLLDPDGQQVDPETVKTKPGFAAFVNRGDYSDPKAVIVCTDPEYWGYTRTKKTSYRTPEQQEQKDAEEAAAAAHAEALKTAAGVRREFLLRTYGNARSAKRVYPEALRTAILNPYALGVERSFVDLVTKLAGTEVTPRAVAEAKLDRLTRMVVACWLAGFENEFRAWQPSPRRVCDYFDLLTGDGYQLSEAEQRFYTELQEKIASARAAATDDEDTDDAEELDADDLDEENVPEDAVTQDTANLPDGTPTDDAGVTGSGADDANAEASTEDGRSEPDKRGDELSGESGDDSPPVAADAGIVSDAPNLIRPVLSVAADDAALGNDSAHVTDPADASEDDPHELAASA